MDLYGFVGNAPAARIDFLGMFFESHGCDEDQLSKIIAAESQARTEAEAVVAKLAASFSQTSVPGRTDVESMLTVRFGSAGAAPYGFWMGYNAWHIEMSARINEIVNKFEANDYGVECECSCRGDKLVYVRFWGPFDDDIHFCPKAFEDSTSADELAGGFLHEMFHKATGIINDDMVDYTSRPYADWARCPYYYTRIGSMGASSALQFLLNHYVFNYTP